MVSFLARALFTFVACAALCLSRARLLYIAHGPTVTYRDVLQRPEGLPSRSCPLHSLHDPESLYKSLLRQEALF